MLHSFFAACGGGSFPECLLTSLSMNACSEQRFRNNFSPESLRESGNRLPESHVRKAFTLFHNAYRMRGIVSPAMIVEKW